MQAGGGGLTCPAWLKRYGMSPAGAEMLPWPLLPVTASSRSCNIVCQVCREGGLSKCGHIYPPCSIMPLTAKYNSDAR